MDEKNERTAAPVGLAVVAEVNRQALMIRTESEKMLGYVKGLQIVAQSDYDEAEVIKGRLDRGIKFLKGIYEPLLKADRELLDSHRAQRDGNMGAAEEALKIIKGRMAVWVAEQMEKKRKAEEAVREAKRKADDDARLQAAVEAEKSGQPEVAELILGQNGIPVPSAVVTVDEETAEALAFEKPKGLSTRRTWYVEVVDKSALIKAAADKTDFWNLVKGWNELARMMDLPPEIPEKKSAAKTYRECAICLDAALCRMGQVSEKALDENLPYLNTRAREDQAMLSIPGVEPRSKIGGVDAHTKVEG